MSSEEVDRGQRREQPQHRQERQRSLKRSRAELSRHHGGVSSMESELPTSMEDSIGTAPQSFRRQEKAPAASHVAALAEPATLGVLCYDCASWSSLSQAALSRLPSRATRWTCNNCEALIPYDAPAYGNLAIFDDERVRS